MTKVGNKTPVAEPQNITLVYVFPPVPPWIRYGFRVCRWTMTFEQLILSESPRMECESIVIKLNLGIDQLFLPDSSQLKICAGRLVRSFSSVIFPNSENHLSTCSSVNIARFFSSG